VRLTRAAGIGVATALLACTGAQASQLSTSDRLQDRREVAAGTRAYSVGFEDGRFYANGWHITGEMGGVWTPPMKIVDGVWFGVNGEWAGQATRFTSGWGYTRYRLPAIDGLRLQRTDFVPDGVRGALFGLKITNPDRRKRTVTVKVDARSELMGQFPWGFDGLKPNAADNLPDTGEFTGKALAFRDKGTIPDGAAHDYAGIVGSDRKPRRGRTGDGFWGAQSGTECTGKEPAPGKMPRECDDGPFGNGTGGELRYKVKVQGHGSTTLWVGAAGSDEGPRAARREFKQLVKDPDRALARKKASRRDLSKWSQVDLPGDPRLADAIDWGKQNLADLTLTAKNLQVRWTDQGKQFPAPSGTVPSITWFGAGYPDYPWLFATDGEYTSFAGVALGQFETAEAHLKALRDVSEKLNPGTGVVVHETVPDGSVYFGKDDKQASGTNNFNTDETVKFPSTVALVWRWTGDDRFMRSLYDFSRQNLHYVVEKLDADGDGWPSGSGNVERPGMGDEKLDNAVYLIRGLYDFEAMAKATGHADDAQWAREQADQRAAKFESTWWDQAATQYADSLTEDAQTFQKHWIGVNPMEAELHQDGESVPGAATYVHGARALAVREGSDYSGQRPYNQGLFHTGAGGGQDGNGDLEIFSLNTAIQAVGEGNYGRMGAGQQKRYTDADAETMFGEPALDGEGENEPDEQPGAMPEILPSPGFDATGPNDKNILRCFTCRSMFMQAWGNYGTAWPVIHQQLGVDPDLGNGRLDVVPQVPDGQPSVQGRDIRLGDGSVDVLAAHDGSTYTTRIDASSVHASKVNIGQTLPRGTQPESVTLDGEAVTDYAVEETNRGTEVTVATDAGRHTLVVTS
jgi:hypothetical protein